MQNDTPLGTKKLFTKGIDYFYMKTVNKREERVEGEGHFEEAVVWVHKTHGLESVLLVLICLKHPQYSPCAIPG